MRIVTYNWQRFWYPRESTIELLDGGYLYKPNREWARFLQPNIVPLESLSHIPCLILLGEPGIGKSNELRKLEIFTREQLTETAFWFDLGGYQTDTMLNEELFKASVFQAWLAGTHQLHLFLDGLDEGLLTIPVITRLLERILQKCPVSRLRLRITCRTADWPNSLEEALRLLWNKGSVEAYQLAPLQKVDVSEAAAANGLNPEHFLDEVARREIVPLAIKPLTLRFLLNTYREKGTFPLTQVELYNDGCRLLCEEVNENRRDAGFIGNLTGEQRLITASRIAALTIFTNRAAVWTGVDQGDMPEGDIQFRELWGGRENVNGHEIAVGETALKETLATGLFSSRGPKSMGWAHRTYAEFLAARYLVQHQVDVAQIISFLVHPGDTEGRLIPQLHETAAWLATMRPDVFREVMKIDPEVLLRSDIATADESDRANLVVALLNLPNEARLIYLHNNFYSFYSKLSHSDLSTQLHPYIADNTTSDAVKLMVIDVAEACKLQSLQESLLAIALDSSQPQLVREEAAQALVRIGDEQTKAKLKTLVAGDSEEDPNDQLKGYALLAVWPAQMKAEELFGVLAPPKNDHFVGSYHVFLASQFLEHLQPSDLPIALNWVEKLPSRNELRYEYKEIFGIADQVMLQAWYCLHIPGVLEAFARATVSKLERFDNILEGSESQELTQQIGDDEKRRRLLDAVFQQLSERHSDPIPLLYCKPQLLQQQDVPWLIEYLFKAKTEVLQRVVVRLVKYSFNENDADLVNKVLAACESNAILASEFTRLLSPIESDSSQPQKVREDYTQEDWLQKKSLRADRPSIELLITCLGECEQGDIFAWNRLYRKMTHPPMVLPTQLNFVEPLFQDGTSLMKRAEQECWRPQRSTSKSKNSNPMIIG